MPLVTLVCGGSYASDKLAGGVTKLCLEEVCAVPVGAESFERALEQCAATAHALPAAIAAAGLPSPLLGRRGALALSADDATSALNICREAAIAANTLDPKAPPMVGPRARRATALALAALLADSMLSPPPPLLLLPPFRRALSPSPRAGRARGARGERGRRRAAAGRAAGPEAAVRNRRRRAQVCGAAARRRDGHHVRDVALRGEARALDEEDDRRDGRAVRRVARRAPPGRRDRGPVRDRGHDGVHQAQGEGRQRAAARARRGRARGGRDGRGDGGGRQVLRRRVPSRRGRRRPEVLPAGDGRARVQRRRRGVGAVGDEAQAPLSLR